MCGSECRKTFGSSVQQESNTAQSAAHVGTQVTRRQPQPAAVVIEREVHQDSLGVCTAQPHHTRRTNPHPTPHSADRQKGGHRCSVPIEQFVEPLCHTKGSGVSFTRHHMPEPAVNRCTLNTRAARECWAKAPPSSAHHSGGGEGTQRHTAQCHLSTIFFHTTHSWSE